MIALQTRDLARAGSLFVFLAAALVRNSIGQASEPTWHNEAEAKWKELEPPAEGRVGFTRLPPGQTGIQFTNVLDEQASAANRVLENGSGVALGDFDGDGRLDIFLCSLEGQNALYHNLGNWRFEDVTAKAGLAITNYCCRGAVFADVNGDGRPDLLISTLGHGVLCFLNSGQGGFTNGTATAGTATHYGSMTMTLADIDGNGTLDLYVANYRSSDIRDNTGVEVRRVNGRVELAPQWRDRLFIAKEGLIEFGEPDVLYLNDGRGHFSAVSWTGGNFRDEAGDTLAGSPMDWGLSASFRDLDGNGAPDLYVCNDYWTPDRLWLNNGVGVFRAVPRTAVRHTSENSMGVDFADVDRDGHMDFLVLDMLSRSALLRRTQLAAQTKLAQMAAVGEINNRPQIMRNTLFHNRGDGTFEEIADFAGLPASDWSWQPVFVDVDLDGYEDLIISAGHRRDVQDADATAKILSLPHTWRRVMEPAARQETFTREMLEHSRLYPELLMPIIAFRNRGNLKFEETTSVWGTDDLGIHQGIAFGDLDGDGDLDFVVNNLNGVAGVYRNESKAPRVAVRLRGLAPNTSGIGSLIKILGGAVPMQSQEVICGGRYLSGDDPMRVFAAGRLTNEMTIEVRWRSGRQSVVTGVRANRLYEIDEAHAKPAEREKETRRTTWFEDVSQKLQHSHHDEEFDDFAKQPLLPRKLSQLGPGVAWMDVDGDGLEDLVIGSGKGGALTVFRNQGKGSFAKFGSGEAVAGQDQAAVIAWPAGSNSFTPAVSVSSYEDDPSTPGGIDLYPGAGGPTHWLAGWTSSIGPLASCDIDGSGHLALFAGGRVIPGRYPEAATSRIYTNDGQSLHLALEMKDVGLVSGAVWSDLDGDGFPELILACEWGPVRIFHNDRGRLTEQNPGVQIIASAQGGNRQCRLSELTGWWNGVTTADLDGDGRMDIIASNWGENTKYERYRAQPLQLRFGDFNQDGSVQLVEAFYATELKRYVPWRGLDTLGRAMPWVRGAFASNAQYARASVEEVLGERASAGRKLEAHTLESMVFLNRGDHFEARPLPAPAQFSPAFGICAADFDGDGREDVFLSQNFFDFDSDTPRLDGGRGLMLKGDGTGNLIPVPGQQSGILVYGEQRGCAACDYDGDGRVDLVVTQNGAETKLYHNQSAKPGLRVRLQGPLGNPRGFGAQMRLLFHSHPGPMREVHGGSGYWSQDSPSQVLGAPERPEQIWVRWPGGKTTSQAIPSDAREVVVFFPTR